MPFGSVSQDQSAATDSLHEDAGEEAHSLRSTIRAETDPRLRSRTAPREAAMLDRQHAPRRVLRLDLSGLRLGSREPREIALDGGHARRVALKCMEPVLQGLPSVVSQLDDVDVQD